MRIEFFFRSVRDPRGIPFSGLKRGNRSNGSCNENQWNS